MNKAVFEIKSISLFLILYAISISIPTILAFHITVASNALVQVFEGPQATSESSTYVILVLTLLASILAIVLGLKILRNQSLGVAHKILISIILSLPTFYLVNFLIFMSNLSLPIWQSLSFNNFYIYLMANSPYQAVAASTVIYPTNNIFVQLSLFSLKFLMLIFSIANPLILLYLWIGFGNRQPIEIRNS